jgi:hypothetical protein
VLRGGSQKERKEKKGGFEEGIRKSRKRSMEVYIEWRKA